MRKPTLLSVTVTILFAMTLSAADIPLTNWTAPPTWSPTSSDGRFSIAANVDLTHGMPFFAITPCRAYDSRVAVSGDGPIPAATARTIDIDGSSCGPIPTGVGAYSLNITVFGSTSAASYAFITAYPTGSTRPPVSSLNFLLGTQVSNAVIVPAGTGGDIDIYASSATEVVVDINGYYSNVFNPGRALVAQVTNQVAIVGSSDSNWGILGASNSSFGIVGSTSGGTGAAGVVGTSTNARGVYGLSTNYNGVWAESTTHDGLFSSGGRDGGYLTGTRHGVVGNAAPGANNIAGVLGTVPSGSGASGVRGLSPNALPGDISGFWNIAGVSGYSTTGYGVNGVSETNGVQGVIVTPGGGIAGIQARGRLGYVTGGNYFGVYSNGNAHVAGTLSKTGGSFKIDHPVDPQNKTLSHSFVESPDMMNIYNGNVTLDAEGRAVVQMPDYFQALNRDFRYQLTPIGAPAVLYIEQEVSANQFIIAGGQAGMRVSWTVTGVRQDAWAEKFRIPVEEMKRPEDRGYYLNPEAFDLPAEKSIEAAEESRRPGDRERIR
jgi:hypothetical protein